MYLGDFLPGQMIRVPWSTNSKTGAAITRAANGVIAVYRGADLAESNVGVTDVEDFDGVTGLHLTSVDTTSGFYIPHEDYRVCLVGSTVDGEAVSAVLGAFSILNRSHSFLMKSGTVSAATTTRFQCADITEPEGRFQHRTVYCAFGSTIVREVGVIHTHTKTNNQGDFVLTAPMTQALAPGDRVILI
jgi:hypothetical protein